jgi:hypothetical protein
MQHLAWGTCTTKLNTSHKMYSHACHTNIEDHALKQSPSPLGKAGAPNRSTCPRLHVAASWLLGLLAILGKRTNILKGRVSSQPGFRVKAQQLDGSMGKSEP